jgi:hypothetical protein
MEKEKRIRRFPLASYNYIVTDPVYVREDKSYRSDIIKSETELVYSIHARGPKELAFRTEFIKGAIDEALAAKYTQTPEMSFMKSGEVGEKMISMKATNYIHSLAHLNNRKVLTKKVTGTAAQHKGVKGDVEIIEAYLITIVE